MVLQEVLKDVSPAKLERIHSKELKRLHTLIGHLKCENLAGNKIFQKPQRLLELHNIIPVQTKAAKMRNCVCTCHYGSA